MKRTDILAGPGGVKTRSFGDAKLEGVKIQSFDEGQVPAEFVSIGGGRGALDVLDGDYPIALMRRVSESRMERIREEGCWSSRLKFTIRGKMCNLYKRTKEYKNCSHKWS